MIGAPGRYDPTLYAGQPGGDDEIHWFRLCLRDLELEDRVILAGAAVCRGSPLPAPDDVDAVVLGGSWHSVHENLPWQRSTAQWLGGYRRTGRPLLAICGGHQLVAVMLGGRVAALDGGPCAGSHAIRLTAAGRRHTLFEGFPAAPRLHFANFDHVEDAPPGATVLARSGRIPHAAVDFGASWYGVQFHPEATHGNLAASWRDAAPAMAESYRPLPGAIKMIANFLVGTAMIE